MAVRQSHLDVVRCLIEEGEANVNTASADGETPLLLAVSEGSVGIVRLLIEENKANVEQANEEGKTLLFFAVQRCSREVLRQANSKATPLSTTGYKSDVDMLRWLVVEGHANVNTVSVKEATPLLFAQDAKVVNIEVVCFLLSAGARVGDLKHPVFINYYTRASILEEVQKLEVLINTRFLYHFLSPHHSLLNLHVPLFMYEGGSHRACDARGDIHHAL
jgi:hypothetical protein